MQPANRIEKNKATFREEPVRHTSQLTDRQWLTAERKRATYMEDLLYVLLSRVFLYDGLSGAAQHLVD